MIGCAPCHKSHRRKRKSLQAKPSENYGNGATLTDGALSWWGLDSDSISSVTKAARYTIPAPKRASGPSMTSCRCQAVVSTTGKGSRHEKQREESRLTGSVHGGAEIQLQRMRCKTRREVPNGRRQPVQSSHDAQIRLGRRNGPWPSENSHRKTCRKNGECNHVIY